MSSIREELDPKEIKKTAQILSDILISNPPQITLNLPKKESLSITVTDIYTIEEIDLDLIVSGVGGIVDPIGQLKDWFADILSSIASWIISGIETFIETAIKPILNTINSTITNIWSEVQKIAPVVLDPIYDAIKWVSEQFEGLKDLASSLLDSLNSVFDSLSKLAQGLIDNLQALGESLNNVIQKAISSISDYITNIGEAISGVFSSLESLTEKLGKSLTDMIQKGISGIESLISNVTDFLSTIPDSIIEAIQPIINLITTIPDTIINGITQIFTTLQSLMEPITETFRGWLESIPQITEGIVTAIMGISQIGETITGFIQYLVNLKEEAPAIYSNIIEKAWATTIQPLFDSINEGIIKPFQEGLKEIIDNVTKGFNSLAQTTQGFVNAIMNFPTWFPEWFNEYITTPLTSLPSIWMSPQIFAEIRVNLKSIFNIFWGEIKTLSEALVSGLQNLLKFFWDSLQNIQKGVANIISEITKEFWDSTIQVMEKSGKAIQPLAEHYLKPLPESIASQTHEFLIQKYEEILKAEQMATPEYFKIDYVKKAITTGSIYAMTVSWIPFYAQIPLRMAQWVMRGVARSIGELGWKHKISLKPLGIGYETEIDISKIIGASLYTFATNIGRWMDELGRGMIYGYAIWLTRPIGRLINYWLRNVLPIIAPRDDEIIEFLRRNMAYIIQKDPTTGVIREVKPTERYKEILKIAKFFLSIYGHSDVTLDWFFKYTPDMWIKVKDRFGTFRNIPLSLVHKLPTSSELCRMMVRDLFYSLEDFTKAIQTQGMIPDIAYLYYLLHFRYASPERLWSFISRGISGMLWVSISDSERRALEKVAQTIGAFTPIAPIELNFKYSKLFDALKTYMKWHDYARFSWIKGFTSDNLIVIDTLADIPTKIDQRWMTRWGLYNILSERGVKITSPVSAFREKLIEPSASSEIKLDLSLFSRTLQATGLHPDWVPLTAVAETINTLVDERTLLRTGFINLFKEGFWNINALEKLLAGFITASFKVSYFDTSENKWVTGWVNYPVMYLPPERKLLELRALMDRALDILRDTVRDLSRGYSEFIIQNYEEFKEKLTGIIEKINEFFAKDYEKITGVKLPDELKLAFVEEYYSAYINSLNIWRDIYTIRRVRYWTQRWLGYVMYRVTTGVVKREDVEALADYVGEKAKLTDYEKEFIKGVLDRMVNIAIREYIPTPTQLATLSEYLVIKEDLIDKALTERLVPDEWKPIWKQYIEIRPIADDIKSLLTTYRRALIYIKIPEDIESKIKEYMEMINFTDKEMEILKLRVELEEMILQARQSMREYIPTPSMLATISEYIPKAREYFDDVVKAKRIPEKWQPIWAEYIDLRPIMDEVKKMISRAEDLYVYFIITEDDYKKILNQLKNFGYTDKELELMLTSSRYERHYRAFRELVGDVDRMVMLSEYSPQARSYALGQLYKMIDALPVDEETKNVLKAMWEQFIRLKPIMDEVRRYITELLSDFASGIITEEEFVKELEALKEWGLDDYEIMFYKAIGGMRRARYLARRQRGM
ncbi:MAG: hypothetical protein DRP01_01610 [Archaeoglobales archaeon]|nr:MAG: hypothetical protein DRP01_01610 [Archaeoglobales archaeon]